MIRIHDGVRSTEMRQSELARLAYELTDLTTWAGMRELLARPDVSGRPWHVFAEENTAWA